MSMSAPGECPRSSEVSAYLLGALQPGERADYAAHLADCPACLREVGQLAGLPGLLSRVTGLPGTDPAEPDQSKRSPMRPSPREPAWIAPAGPGEPDTVSAALAEIRHRRARRHGLVAAALVLMAMVGVGGTVLVQSGTAPTPTTGVTAAARLPVPMHPVGDADATAAVALTTRPWGTEVVMRCRYTGGPEDRAPVFTLVALGADGTSTQLAQWIAVPDQDIVLASTTQLTGSRLSALEVRDASGQVVLRTDHL